MLEKNVRLVCRSRMFMTPSTVFYLYKNEMRPSRPKKKKKKEKNPSFDKHQNLSRSREWTIFNLAFTFRQTKHRDLIITLSLLQWQMFRLATCLGFTSTDHYSQEPLWHGHRVESSAIPWFYISKKKVPLRHLPENRYFVEETPEWMLPQPLRS